MHPRFAPFLFGLVVSGLMSLLVSGVATFRTLGMVQEFGERWMAAWPPALSVAFPTILIGRKPGAGIRCAHRLQPGPAHPVH